MKTTNQMFKTMAATLTLGTMFAQVGFAAQKVVLQDLPTPFEESIFDQCDQELVETGVMAAEPCLANFALMEGSFTCSGKPLEQHELHPVVTFVDSPATSPLDPEFGWSIGANYPEPGIYQILVPVSASIDYTYYVQKKPCLKVFGKWICNPVAFHKKGEDTAEYVFKLDQAPQAGDHIVRDIDICAAGAQ